MVFSEWGGRGGQLKERWMTVLLNMNADCKNAWMENGKRLEDGGRRFIASVLDIEKGTKENEGKFRYWLKCCRIEM